MNISSQRLERKKKEQKKERHFLRALLGNVYLIDISKDNFNLHADTMATNKIQLFKYNHFQLQNTAVFCLIIKKQIYSHHVLLLRTNLTSDRILSVTLWEYDVGHSG